MLKINFLITVFLLVSALSADAQRADSVQTPNKPLKNKKGYVITPEKGDYAVGVDATPFLTYIGSMFMVAEDPNEAPTFGFTAQNPGMIYFKYVKSERTAYRAALRIGFSNEVDKQDAGDDEVNRFISTAANLGIAAGIEKSPIMKSRLRGFYGASVIVTTSPYAAYDPITGNYVVGRLRYVDADDSDFNYLEKGGSTISAGLGAFAGVEYFILPKISLTGQFDFRLMFAYQIKRKLVPETGDESVIDAGGSSIVLDNMASGNLGLMFYF